MKIRDIMRPWSGEKHIKNTIKENCHVHNIKSDYIIGNNTIIEVVNDEEN